MKIIPLISLCVVCLIMSVLYTIFNEKRGWQGLLVRGLTSFSLLCLSLILASLKSITNALSLCVTISLGLFIIKELLVLVEMEEKVKKLFDGVLNSLIYLLISLSSLSLAVFNYFALLGGLLLGGGLGLLIWAIRKDNDKITLITDFSQYIFISLIIAFSINGLVRTLHLLSTIFILTGGALILISKVIKDYGKNKKIIDILSNAVLMTGMLMIVCSTYFF